MFDRNNKAETCFCLVFIKKSVYNFVIKKEVLPHRIWPMPQTKEKNKTNNSREELTMIQKYTWGTPIKTDAVVSDIPVSSGSPAFGQVSAADGFRYSYALDPEDIVFGLGEANRGINKRGYIYTSFCTDDPIHTEDKVSLYGAHNFIIVSGKETFGLFIDYPGALTFDIGYSHIDNMEITCENADLDLYEITGTDAYDITRQFRRIIGKSYIPPKFAFGYGQSRWGYKTKEDFESVVNEYREHHIPLDLLYMDIDYMDHYKDFTVNKENFPDFKAFTSQMKERGIHLIPIIDAGVKIEEGYDVYEEGVRGGYFCKKENGELFEPCVWPGLTHFPDFLDPKVREWFGSKYKYLLDAGIEGFWNDMNEPAVFYSPEGRDALLSYLAGCENQKDGFDHDELHARIHGLSNSSGDYRSFYHNINGTRIRHDKVHNLYGFNMTRAASEAFAKYAPEKRILMFSRSSYIGMHRYGGIWTGDNESWWSHILLNLKMLPSLNMCGFLYIGADLGGFGANTTEDLLLRWLALGIFTPLMRNHSAIGTREQECYRFDHIDDFRHIINTRYRLIPYLYSEYLKAAQNDDMYFKPLAFVYPEDAFARRVEDQLMLGNEIMITPVYTQNAIGRYVYLPEEMKFIKFLPDGSFCEKTMEKGHHFIEVALNEVPLFIRKNKKIPLVEPAEYVSAIDMDTLTFIGYPDAEYELADH